MSRGIGCATGDENGSGGRGTRVLSGGSVTMFGIVPTTLGTECMGECESLRLGFGSTMEDGVSFLRSDLNVAPESLKLGHADDDKTLRNLQTSAILKNPGKPMDGLCVHA